MTTNEQVILQSILAKIDRVERAILEQRLQQQKVELLGKDILTVDECAALLGLSTNQLYKLTSSAEIPYFKLGKHLRFERQAIMDWVEEQRVSSRHEIEKGQQTMSPPLLVSSTFYSSGLRPLNPFQKM